MTQLFVKEVKTKGRRYIVCRNEAEAEKDAADRRAIVEALDQQLKRGDKALIGNSAYRRYLRATAKKAFEIDPGKIADEARYDGLFVLRTNARITPLQAVLRYRDLILVRQATAGSRARRRRTCPRPGASGPKRLPMPHRPCAGVRREPRRSGRPPRSR